MNTIISTALAAVTTAALLSGGATAAPAERPISTTEDLSAMPTPSITWRVCDPTVPAFECATIDLPTDYDRPNGPSTTVALIRLPASDPARRLGSIALNFGGPGGPGLTTLPAVAEQVVPAEVRARYDLVSFDPRAVGASDPATCYATPGEEAASFAGTLAFPTTADEIRAFLREARELSATCRARSAERFQHASTANVARDMEMLRRAVGDARLNYIGYSYGTYLGATYARLFPDRVGRFILDGTVDPVAWSGAVDPRSTIGIRTGQGRAGAEVFDQFLRECRAAGERCALNALGDPATVVETALQRVTANPVTLTDPTGQPQTYTYDTTVATLFLSMYDSRGWAATADLIATLADGNSARLLRQPTTLARPQRGVDYPSLGGSLASLCVDQSSRVSTASFASQAEREAQLYGPIARFRAWVGVQCSTLNLRDSDAYTGPWDQTTSATVMVIGTRFDPATPYRFTRPYAARFPDARMVTVEGYGHTTVGRSSCVQQLIAHYVLDGVAPADTTCAQDDRPFSPTSDLGTAETPQLTPLL